MTLHCVSAGTPRSTKPPSAAIHTAINVMADSTASPVAPTVDETGGSAAPPPSAATAIFDVEVASAVPSGLATPVGGAPSTPGTVNLSAEEQANSVRVSLADLCAKAQARYAHRQYEDAAEIFSQAAEMQAELNGEMAPENAEILFFYGRALFKVGQGKSDVLGGKAPDTDKAAAKKKGGANGVAKAKKAAAAASARANGESSRAAESEDVQQRIAEEGVAIVAQEATGGPANPEEALEAKKPLFQFTGDENFDDSDEEEEEVSVISGWRVYAISKLIVFA